MFKESFFCYFESLPPKPVQVSEAPNKARVYELKNVCNSIFEKEGIRKLKISQPSKGETGFVLQVEGFSAKEVSFLWKQDGWAIFYDGGKVESRLDDKGLKAEFERMAKRINYDREYNEKVKKMTPEEREKIAQDFVLKTADSISNLNLKNMIVDRSKDNKYFDIYAGGEFVYRIFAIVPNDGLEPAIFASRTKSFKIDISNLDLELEVRHFNTQVNGKDIVKTYFKSKGYKLELTSLTARKPYILKSGDKSLSFSVFFDENHTSKMSGFLVNEDGAENAFSLEEFESYLKLKFQLE